MKMTKAIPVAVALSCFGVGGAEAEAALGTSSPKRKPQRDLHGPDRAHAARHTRISSAAEAALPLWEQAEVP